MSMHWSQALLNILFPPSCAACRVRLDPRTTSGLCHRCYATALFLQQPLCRMCGMELLGDADRDFLCGDCLANTPPFSVARSVVRYESVVKQLVQRLKYGGDTSVMRGIGEVARGADLSSFVECDWIIPVPLHPVRHRSRGHNQAALIAGALFPARVERIRTRWLVRTRHTEPQTNLGGIERRKNLVGAFSIRDASQLQGATACLVDDVYTTGTTVRECATVLLQHGAAEVRVLTLARTAVPGRGRRL